MHTLHCSARQPATRPRNLKRLGEFGLIDRIRKLSYRRNPSLLIGIGDDAAAIKSSAGQATLVTTDLLLEGIHFDLEYTDFYSLGWKAAAVNLSDVAAMGALPTCCLTALGIPCGISSDQVLDFYRGFNALLRTRKTMLVGGDTCASKNGFFVSVTAMGQAEEQLIVTRSGARPGDRIFVTGTLGDSAAGLEILQAAAARPTRKKKIRIKKSEITTLVERHLLPEPRSQEGHLIARSRCASAMIDISDGLSSDLTHICEESGVGAEINAVQIPISPALCAYSATKSKQPLAYALSGGEDYELLFTVPESRLDTFWSLKLRATEIGVITKKSRVRLVKDDGNGDILEPTGYDHFAGMARSL